MLQDSKIIEILNDWNFWNKNIDTGIERTDYLEKINKHFKAGMIITLVGLRRSGKSTLMLQFAKRLIQQNKYDANNILYVNFEDSRFLGSYSLELLNNIYEVYLAHVKPKKKPVIFLDEIQNITGWEKFVNSLYERKVADIFVSGSNSNLLNSEMSSVLTGRQIVLTVYPLAFKEFLNFHNIKITNNLDLANHRREIKKLCSEYAQYGGMPKIFFIPDKAEKEAVLRNYIEDILNRDLIGRLKIRQTEKLKTLTKFYLTNISSLISFNKVKDFLKIPIGTVERFSDYLTQPFVLYFVSKFARSLKEQSINPRKIYVGDIGLRNAVSFSLGEDRGKILENLVANHLKKINKEFYYYKTKNNLEVDFLIKDKQKVKELIQVTQTIKKFDTKEREIKSLEIAMDELKLKSGIIITEDEEEIIKIGNKKIKVVSIYSWLLDL